MRMDFNTELNQIKEEIDNYQNMPPLTDEEESYKKNKALKNKLKSFIEKVIKAFESNTINVQEKNDLITKALIVLAESTGCAEDLEIADNILDDLYEKEYISATDLNTFKENANTGRWD
jgi:hypothetical protein